MIPSAEGEDIRDGAVVVAEGVKASRVVVSEARRRAEEFETEPTSDQLAPLSVEYLSDPLVVVTAVMAMPCEALESTSP